MIRAYGALMGRASAAAQECGGSKPKFRPIGAPPPLQQQNFFS